MPGLWVLLRRMPKLLQRTKILFDRMSKRGVRRDEAIGPTKTR